MLCLTSVSAVCVADRTELEFNFMAAKIESTTVISRPIDEVFTYVLDLQNAKDFDPDVESVRKIQEGPIRVGTEFEFYERVPPFGRYGYARVSYTVIEPNRWIGFQASIGNLSPVGGLEFEKIERGTRVTFRGEANPSGFLKLLSPIVARKGKETWDKRLASLKAWLESHES